jgi:hypothetical protein
MASATIRNATSNQMTVDYDRSRLLIGSGYETKRRNYANISGALETVVEGTVMGIVTATQKLVPCVSTAVDGSQIPVTILLDSLEGIAIAGTVDSVLTIHAGTIRRDKIVFQNGSDTLATVVESTGGDSKTMEDWLIQNMANVEFATVVDSTKFDN